MSSKNDNTKFFVLPIIIAAVLFISIADLPYSFYRIMRIVVPLLSAIYLFFAFTSTDGFNLMHLPNIIIVILWNPIAPIYMDKDSWIIIDLIAGISQVIMTFYAYRLYKNDN